MVVIIIVSIISNILLYAIFRSMEAIAVATLITSVIWFIIGEIDFKEYMLKLNNYIYIFVQIAVFLVCGQMISNAILGCLVYVVMTIIITIIFMSDTLIYALSEVKPYINKIFKRR